EYSPLLFGLGYVSLRADGHYYCLDGQHRCAAAIIAHNDERVPFRVLRGLTIEEEARRFEQLQQNRLAVSAFDRFVVGVTAKNPANLDIVRVLETFGLTYGMGQKDGCIAAVDALVKIYEGRVRSVAVAKKPPNKAAVKLPKSQLLSRTLQILTHAWGRDRSAFDRVLLNGVAALLYKHDTRVDTTRLCQLLAKKDSP